MYSHETVEVVKIQAGKRQQAGGHHLAGKLDTGRQPEHVVDDACDIDYKQAHQEIKTPDVDGNKLLRIPNTSNISFEYIESEAILMMFDQLGICASSGSACTTGSVGASHVLSAMGLSPMQARGSVRFSLSRYTTDKDIDVVLEHLPSIINKLRAMSPLNEAHPDNV